LFLRIREGRSPFYADRRHTHHVLLDRGHSHAKVVTIEYCIGTFVALCSVAATAYGRTQKPLFLLAFCACLGLLAGFVLRDHPLFKSIKKFISQRVFLATSVGYIRLFACGFVALCVFHVAELANIGGYIYLGMAALLLPSFIFKNAKMDFYSKFIVLAALSFLAWNLNRSPVTVLWGTELYDFQGVYNFLFVGLAVAVSVLLMNKQFTGSLNVHPSDLLLSFSPVFLLFFPKEVRIDNHLVVVCFRVFFLYVGFNLVSRHTVQWIPSLRKVLLIGLCLLALRSFV
jgi:hypothetical protein